MTLPSKFYILWIASLSLLLGCKIYGFKGISIPADISTYAVEDFSFSDPQCEAGVEQEFAEALRQKIRDASRLTNDDTDPDILFEGKITACKTSFVAPTEGSTTSLNRLELNIKVKYINNLDEKAGWDKNYNAFQDYDSNQDFQSLKEELTASIIEDITERIFNDAFTNW